MIGGRPKQLAPWEASYIRRAFSLRRHLTNKALAHKFGLHENTIIDYGLDRHKRYGRPWP